MPLSDRIYNKARALGLLRRPALKYRTYEPGEIPEKERHSTDVHKAFYQNTGSVVHKWRHYLDIYERHLAGFRGREARVLEIGVFRGGSLRMWRQYFGPQTVLYGIDIDEHCRSYDGEAGAVRIGSQADPAFLTAVADEMGGLDVVIDDGSHIASHQRISFDVLFPLLSERGVYICEDTHTSYWRGHYEGGFRRRSTFVERAKKIIDDLHGEFHDRALSIPDACRSIGGIHFYNSMVVIEKSPSPATGDLKVGA